MKKIINIEAESKDAQENKRASRQTNKLMSRQTLIRFSDNKQKNKQNLNQSVEAESKGAQENKRAHRQTNKLMSR